MKKFIVLGLAGLLIVIFSTTVYAQAPKLEFRVSGFIDAQTFFQNNVPPRNTSAGPLRVTPGTSTFWAYGSGMGPGGNLTGVRTAGLNQTQAYWDSRASLKLDMVMGPNLSGTIMFEIDSAQWGSGPNGTATSTGGGERLMESVTGPPTDRPRSQKRLHRFRPPLSRNPRADYSEGWRPAHWYPTQYVSLYRWYGSHSRRQD